MSEYKTFRTATGKRIMVKVSQEEAAAARMYSWALVVLPFVSSVLLCVLWLGIG